MCLSEEEEEAVVHVKGKIPFSDGPCTDAKIRVGEQRRAARPSCVQAACPVLMLWSQLQGIFIASCLTELQDIWEIRTHRKPF